MRIANYLLTTISLALLGNLSSIAHAADQGAIRITSIAQIEVEVTDAKGKKILKRTPVETAIPGTEVIYSNIFENIIKKPVSNIVIDNPIPNASIYKAGSAYGKKCEIVFSIDGGKTFGHADELKIKGPDGNSRAALPKEYTNIRWTYKGKLGAGKKGEVGFRAIVK